MSVTGQGGASPMHFLPTTLPGVFVVEMELREDERGFFARSWCAAEFAAHGLDTGLAQCSVSYNKRRGTLRGMHFQAALHAEVKLVRCTAGAVYDVAVDLRPHSPTFRRWTATELTAENRRALYVPKGCGHGFQTLTAGAEVLYHMSEVYHAEAARGVRWNDPAFGIRWPLADPFLSERDAAYADFLEPDL